MNYFTTLTNEMKRESVNFSKKMLQFTAEVNKK